MAFGKNAVDYEARIDFPRLRQERLARAKERVNQDGLGAYITWDPANIRYLTSYYVTTPLRFGEMQFVVLPRNGEPHLFGGSTPSEISRRMPWLEGRVAPGFGILKVHAKGPDDLMLLVETVARILAEHGVENEPLGLDGTSLELFYAEAFSKVGIKTVHAKSTLDQARMIKTRDEIELMRITCANSEKVFAEIIDHIRPGIRECDLVGIGLKVLYELGVDHTEDLVCCSGYNTNPFGWSFTDKPVRPGDLIYIDVDGASYQGYMSCVYRTFCCGKATQEQKDLYEECRAMLYGAIEVVKDGCTTLDIVEQWPDSPQYWGYDTWAEVGPYAVGHGLGLALHDPPYIRPALARQRPETMKEGMVFALETWTGKKGGKHGVRLEEDILVTKDGYEVLTRFPVSELMECWLPY